MKTFFFGTPRFAQIVLDKLIASPFKPQLVITVPDTKSGRGQTLQPSPVKQTALKHDIDVLQPTNLSDPNFKFQINAFARPKVANFKFDLGILVAYGKIIPAGILSIPTYGFVNVHPSLLPKHRGPSPIQSAILAGERKTGVTIIKLDEQVDHGPIIAQKEITIEKDDTHASLIEKLGETGSDLLIDTLPQYLSGEIKPKPQNHSKATLTKHIQKSDSYIDLANPPDPQTFNRMIRAFYPWPTVWTKWKVENGKWKIFKLLPAINNLTMEQFNNEPFLIQPEGKRPMSISEFRNGYPEVFEQIKHLFSQKAQSPPILH